MSPELIDGSPYNEKSDIWSAGCVIYELAALRAPFEATNQYELGKKIKACQLTPLPRQYSQELMRTLSEMITLEKERRPTTSELMIKPQISSALREQKVETQKRHVQKYERDIVTKERKVKEAHLRLKEKERELELKSKELDEWEASIQKKEQLLEQTKTQFIASAASSTNQLDVPVEPSLPLNQNQVQHAVPYQKQTPLSSHKKSKELYSKTSGRQRSNTGRNYLDDSPKVGAVRQR